MTLAVAAPAAPAIPYGLLALSSAIAFVVSWGLLHGWSRTFGAFFQWLGNKAISIPLKGLPDVSIHPFGFLLTLDQQIRAGLGRAVVATEHAMVESFRRMVGIIQWTGQELAGLATDTYNAVHGITHTVTHTVTRTLDAKTQALVRKLTVAVDTVQHVSIPGLRSRVKALEHRVSKIAHATAGAIAAPFPRLGRLEKTVKGQAKRITKLEKSVLGTIAAGFGVAILAKAVIGWLRCPSLARNLKGRNCIDSDLLDALLTGTLLIVGTISLVEFAEEVGNVTEEASGLIHGFLRDV